MVAALRLFISVIYCSELLRYFQAKGEEKAKVAPNLNTIFDHFNRVCGED